MCIRDSLYTDHQIFDRYQRYRINGEIRRDEQMTVAELNQLRPGDYVVHIDHGVGRFDGLEMCIRDRITTVCPRSERSLRLV